MKNRSVTLLIVGDDGKFRDPETGIAYIPAIGFRVSGNDLVGGDDFFIEALGTNLVESTTKDQSVKEIIEYDPTIVDFAGIDVFLEILEEILPANKEQRHNITLGENGLELTLMLKDGYWTIIIEQRAKGISSSEIIANIKYQIDKIRAEVAICPLVSAVHIDCLCTPENLDKLRERLEEKGID